MNSRRNRKSNVRTPREKRIVAALYNIQDLSDLGDVIESKRFRTLLQAYRWGRTQLERRVPEVRARMRVMVCKAADVIGSNHGRYRPRRIR